ncbi:hypothetical protein NHQ30_001124 [Ciborinia camelliae]|nr:hypothetical protein NHQ30_001124 [Ciborinia camelliae]
MFGFISGITVLTLVKVILSLGNTSPSYAPRFSDEPTCRYLPSDPAWPNQTVWDQLNQTVGGRLIRGVPLGQPCFVPQLDVAKCSKIKEDWVMLSPFEADPVNVMSPYWLNNSCNPLLGLDNSCVLGNLASYALNVSKAEEVIAGLRFARDNNIRLTIKNTGHDFLGRSTGAGSLALWMHNLDGIAFINYSSPLYTGPAVHVGAGVRYSDLYPVASAKGYRVVGGSCPTIGLTGGYTQGGGHGPLASAYGLGADQVLEWEVVTASGQHLTVSPMHHADLYWALSGGGAGNFAVVLSMKVRVHVDGPVAGAAFSFVNDGNSTAYWAAVNAWLQTLLVLDTIDDLTTLSAITAKAFSLKLATLPDVTTTNKIDTALKPFLSKLGELNISLGNSYVANVHANFAEHYDFWISNAYTSNIAIGGRNIPRSTVQDKDTTLPALINAFRNITDSGGNIFLVAANIAHGNYTPNAVLPSWRDALFFVALSKPLAESADLDDLRMTQAQLNIWQEELRAVTPGGGAYMNEATWDNVHWKDDYFGPNYRALLKIKEKYDPGYLFWANAAVGSDVFWKVGGNGALCRN